MAGAHQSGINRVDQSADDFLQAVQFTVDLGFADRAVFRVDHYRSHFFKPFAAAAGFVNGALPCGMSGGCPSSHGAAGNPRSTSTSLVMAVTSSHQPSNGSSASATGPKLRPRQNTSTASPILSHARAISFGSRQPTENF